MFGQSHEVDLISATTDDCRIVWRDFHESVRLILAVPNDDFEADHAQRLIENVFRVMLLTVGLDELVSVRNVDRLKRDLRASFGLIDHFLAALDHSPVNNYAATSAAAAVVGDITGAVDVVVFPEANAVQVSGVGEVT